MHTNGIVFSLKQPLQLPLLRFDSAPLFTCPLLSLKAFVNLAHSSAQEARNKLVSSRMETYIATPQADWTNTTHWPMGELYFFLVLAARIYRGTGNRNYYN